LFRDHRSVNLAKYGSVTVMVMVFFAGFNGDHASMGRLANGVLELDRRVIDTEIVMQPLFHIPQNSFTHRRRNVRDRNMAGQSMGL